MHRVFVFGSNLAGRHGAGAALHAHRYHIAVGGIGEGYMPRTFSIGKPYSYAIPTKDEQLQTLGTFQIHSYVKRFIDYAGAHPELDFFVTRVGCGLAGYKDHDIAPMFVGAPTNCIMPPEWRPWLGKRYKYHEGECKCQDHPVSGVHP